MNNKYKSEVINGKPVVLLNGNMVEKGFISISNAQARADELNNKPQSNQSTK
ncbi:hypothetical protein [Providencia alcalifaciens]|uniref:hypothetical protein n=1 Tax=Providencia alcalifaciens TaxID=126385 RepID=UPI00131F0D56|nr:hypothetical protein [Providencia alcalifaciens]MBG5881685.1 hypothetical protein [Providencia alcalifaciens]